MKNIEKLDVRLAIPFLEWLGFSFAVDWDDSLVFESPKKIDVAVVESAIGACAPEIVKQKKNIAESERYQFMGGPLAGKRHAVCWTRKVVTHKIRRGHWAVYIRKADWRDPRLYFIGYASSEAKARKKTLSEKARV